MSNDNTSKSEAVDAARDVPSDVNDDSQSIQPSPNNNRGMDHKNNESLSQMQKDTVVATDSNDAAAAINVDNNVSNKDRNKALSDDDDEESNMLLLIPKILRSAIERSRHAEDLIREGRIDDEPSNVVATNDEQTASFTAKQSSITTITATDATNETSSLQLPSSWKRSNYVSKTISEIEKYIANANSNEDTPERDLFNVEYNECSLLALANWAVMDNTPKTSAQSGTLDDDDTRSSPSQWEQYKREQEKLRATSTTKYDMPVPPKNAFRRCGVCRCFGHYEVECDLLVSYKDENDVQVKGSSNEVMLVDNNGSDGKGDDNNKGRKRKRLDEKSKDTVMSKLAKEVRIQRTLHTLLSKELKLKKARGKSEDDGDSSYWVTSQRCNVCLSAHGDESMLVCDGCDELYHMQCLDPPLTSIPEGDWFCDYCQANDDDVSSTVDVEGCCGFVIEQRKRSLAEEERYRRKEDDYVGVSIGEDNPWVAAMSILAQKDPEVVNIDSFKALYMRVRDDEGSGNTEFALNEVVWAKRQFGLIKYWPAIVSKVDEMGLEVKYLPLGDINLDRVHHKSELLPFFPYFEDLGYDRLMTHDLFRRALEVSVLKTGLKTLGQALNFARCGTQLSFQSGTNEVRNTDAARALKNAGWIAPAGWENAEIDEIDGIMIVARDDGSNLKTPQPSPFGEKSVAKSGDSETEIDYDECEICNNRGDLLICDGGGKGGGCNKVFHVECINRDEIPPGDWICMECSNELGFNVGIEGHEWGSENAVKKTETQKNVTAEFQLDEIVGSIVSWQQQSHPKTCYGLVLSVDVEAKTALLRTISILSDSGNYHSLFTQANNSIQVRVDDISSTVWMPMSQLSFVSGRPSESDSYEFTKTLVSHIKEEAEIFESRFRKEEIDRERFMVELALPAPDITNSLPPVRPISLQPGAATNSPAYSRQSSSTSSR